MSSHSQPRVHNQSDEQATGAQIPVLESPLPAFIGGEFLHFLINNRLPNGRANPLPALTDNEFTLHFQQPYRDWAPPPFNNTSDSAFERFMFCFTGMKDMDELASAFTTKPGLLKYTDHHLSFDHVRAWAGLVSLSDSHWKEKGLDEPDKLNPSIKLIKGIQHVEKAITAFTYANIPATIGKIRRIHNTIYNHLADFDRILTAYYAQQSPLLQPDEATRGKLTDLWSEFFFSHVQFITNRAHSWYLKHTETLFDGITDELKTAPAGTDGAVSSEQNAAREKLNCIIQHQCSADFMLLIPLTGFKNDLPHWQHLSSPPVVNWNTYLANGALPLNLSRTFPQDLYQRAGVHFNRCAHIVKRELNAEGVKFIKDGITSFFFASEMSETDKQSFAVEDGAAVQTSEELAAPWKIAWQAMRETRKELRGEPLEIHEELWITRLRSVLERAHGPTSPPRPSFIKWGFVAYRLSYSQSDPDWTTFLDKFKTEVTSWGEGVMGAEHLKSKCSIKWIDGRDVGIPEGDINAARRHFQSIRETHPGFMSGLLTTAHGHFLVADRNCIESYLRRPELPGQEIVDDVDLKSFVIIAETEFDTRHSEGRLDNAAPGYGGWVYVAGCVLFDDVFPGLMGPLYELRALWRMAAAHPGGVYIGPFVWYQKHHWTKFHYFKRELLESMAEDLRIVWGDGDGVGGR